MRRLVGLALAGLLAIAAAACTPRVELPGPAVTTPRLAPDAFVAADGTRLPMRSWLPAGAPKAVILALHGFNDYSSAYEPIGIDLSGHGIAMFAYDQRGFGATDPATHGIWPGTGALVHDADTVAAQLRARYPRMPFYLMGESMGGAVAMVAMTSPGAPAVDGVILAAPAVWGRAAMPWYQRLALSVASHTVPWLKLTGRGLHIRASDNTPMLIALGKDPLFIKETRIDALKGITDLMDAALAAAPRLKAPALLMYGAHDEIIPKAPMFKVMRELPGRAAGRQRVALYADGWHMLLRDLDAEVLWRDVLSWITDPAAPLPSGADVRAEKALADQLP